jgi:arabinofuranosyltransferase
MKENSEQKSFLYNLEDIIIPVAIIFFVALIIKTAWLSDDAYISFRTIDNLINDEAFLRWNIAERVQSYTNPLWLFVLIPFIFITKEFYFTTIFISLISSILTLFLLLKKIAKDTTFGIIAVLLLPLSKAFIDYSTSGLENPLSHLLLVLFVWIYTKEKSEKNLFILSIISSLIALNRLDLFILILPAFIYYFFKDFSFKHFLIAFIGFSPLVFWEFFSLIYYGFLIPNTAYAKLNTGIASTELIKQGFLYLLDSLDRDPITLITIASIILGILLFKVKKAYSLLIGIVLYLSYIIKIGGDFMSGRFLTSIFVFAICTGTYYLLPKLPLQRKHLILIITILFLSLSSKLFNINFKNNLIYFPSDKSLYELTVSESGIADERLFYFPKSGLVNQVREGFPLTHPWGEKGNSYKVNGEKIVLEGNTGFVGFSAGPSVHIVDYLALNDPLLSKLPAIHNEEWRIGHFKRKIPQGYIETLESGENRIKDANLSEYYDHIKIVTRGPIFTKERLKSIWLLNTGQLNYLIDKQKWSTEELD